MSPSASIELRSQGVNTVEDLAELNDSVVLGNPGMVTLRKRAIAYLAACNVEKEDDLETEESPVDVEAMSKDPDAIPAPKRRGRPRKKAA